MGDHEEDGEEEDGLEEGYTSESGLDEEFLADDPQDHAGINYPYPKTYEEALKRKGIKAREKLFRKKYNQEKSDLDGFLKRDDWCVVDGKGRGIKVVNSRVRSLFDLQRPAREEYVFRRSLRSLESTAIPILRDYIYSERKVTAAQWDCERIGVVDGIEGGEGTSRKRKRPSDTALTKALQDILSKM